MTDINIVGDVTKLCESKIEVWPCNSNRASMIDDPCLRKLVYYRTRWDKQVPTGTGLQGIFETGKELEPVIERILSEAAAASNPKWRIAMGHSV
jgi:hypothetical protein